MTIIYSNYLDDDCRILQRIWKGFDNVNVVEITPTSTDYEDIVNEAISKEKDTLIMCGHGTSYGLLFPDMYRGEYIIHENNVHLIKAKKVICTWCYASNFCINNNLHCFATSMFITNEKEAIDNGIFGYNQEQINRNSERFQDEINYFLKNNIPLDEWVMRLGAHMDIENAIDVFNRQCLYYN
jgi:hypothetical protein